ncbi:MAG: SDR family oxidoreductase [Rhizobiales bacterium]|nr:SDR family oxidoreductase [Hyphomicrobiales bacterium]
MSEYTVFGAGGFIGSRLSATLEAKGHAVRRVRRDTWPTRGEALGHVIFTIGMTADFRTKPFETVESQVGLLARALHDYTFESFLALSSTRVYRGAESTAETARLCVSPAEPDDLYNATKIAGEALCLALPNPEIRVVRLSNIYGWPGPSQSFLASVLEEAARTGSVAFRTGPRSSKDYLDIESVIAALTRIAESGRERIYNVAAGVNVSNAELAAALERAGVTTCFEPGAPEPVFPVMDVSRLVSEFGIVSPSLIERLPTLLKAAKER